MPSLVASPNPVPPCGLGREEGLEDEFSVFGGNASARVGHGDHDMRTTRQVGLKSGLAVAKRQKARLHEQLAVVAHGIASVQNQVDHHLLQLSSVCQDDRAGSAQTRLELDVFPYDATEHLREIGNHAIEFERRPLRHLPSGVQQQLAGERASPTGRAFHLVQVWHRRMIAPDEFARD
jgi:hypothetical protein